MCWPKRIDFAILNAGAKNGNFIVNQDTKHESVFQVNYLPTALLTILLLPVLRAKRAAGKPGRLTLVGSGLALVAKFPERNADAIIPAFDDPTRWTVQAAAERYSTTKLILLMFLVKLKDRVDPEEVVDNVADPGFVQNAGFDRHFPFLAKTFLGLLRATIARSTKAGAWTYVDAAILKPDTTHGSWLYNWNVSS